MQVSKKHIGFHKKQRIGLRILLEINFQYNTVLESVIFFVFLKVTYEAIVEDSGVGDFVLGGTTPTGKWEPKN